MEPTRAEVTRKQPVRRPESPVPAEDEETEPAVPRGGADFSLTPVRAALGSPGAPLDPATRTGFEAKFGQDFGAVRVHADGTAHKAALSVDALAFTVGEHIVFRTGHFAPKTSGGERLLGHELTHVVQQRRTGQPRLARQAAPAPPAKPVRFQFRVRVTTQLDEQHLLLEFIKQYRKVRTDAEAEAIRQREDWKFTGTAPVVGDEQVRQGFVMLSVVDRQLVPSTPEQRQAKQDYFDRLSPEDQAELNAETDRLFTERTQDDPGRLLGNSPLDRQQAEYWRTLRDEFLRQRQAIDALPPALRRVLFSDDSAPKLSPHDYATALRIAGKLGTLSPIELAEYQSRTTDTTTDWSRFEASIDRFLDEHAVRAREAEQREQLSTKLFGLEDLYRRYREYRTMLSTSLAGSKTPMGAGTALGMQSQLNETRAALNADLTTAGFAGITGFEAAIHQYETAYERQTMVVATVMLDQYEHLLAQRERAYANPDTATTLHQRVAATGARQSYEEGDRIRDEYFNSGGSTIVLSPEEAATASAYAGRRAEARQRGAQQVGSVSATEPLVTSPDFDRERLARAEPGEVRALMLEYIRARRKDIQDTRENLASSPNMIYGLDELMRASYVAQHIEPNSIQDLIIKDRAREVHFTEAIPQIVLGIIAFAAGLLSGGTGAIAVLGAGTALGIGAYQAVEEFRRYEARSAAYGAGLLSDDPSFGWVIVALVGAGLDLATVASTLRTLRPAIETFNEVNDLAQLEAQLGRVGAEAAEAVRQAARARAEARAALGAVIRPPAVLRAVILPGAEEFGRLVYAVYLNLKAGIREFQAFVRTREATALLGDIAKITGEDLALLKAAHTQALAEIRQLEELGTTLGMTDREIQAFMHLRDTRRGMTAEQLAEEMRNFVGAKGSGVPFGFRDAEHFKEFAETAATELGRELRRADRSAAMYLQGSSLSGISYARQLPFDAASDLDVAIVSRYLFQRAERTFGAEVSVSPRRIGPLSDDLIDKLGLNRALNRMTRVVTDEQGNARRIEFMLFENERAMSTPIGSHSLETTRASVKLQ